MKQLMRKLSWFWIIFTFSPLILWYFTHIEATAIWCWAWGGVWYLFIVSKSDGLTRGLVFIVASVFVAIAGKTIIGPTEHAETIDGSERNLADFWRCRGQFHGRLSTK